MMNIPLGDFARGPRAAASFEALGQRMAPNICYEDLFGEELAARFADAAGAPTVLVNVSNIAWFGDTRGAAAAPAHHAHAHAGAAAADAARHQHRHDRHRRPPRPRERTAAALHRAASSTARCEGRTGVTPYAAWAGRAGLWPLVPWRAAWRWRSRRGPAARAQAGARTRPVESSVCLTADGLPADFHAELPSRSSSRCSPTGTAQGCALLQPYDMEVGAGTSHTATFLRALGPEPWKAAYVQPSRRPKDGRYGDNPNRLQHYYQYQVVLKPAPRTS
jgi:hypothetical protein